MKYFYIGAGGFLGAVCRYLIENVQIPSKAGFPINNFLINLAGSLLLGIVLSISIEMIIKNKFFKHFVTTGFISSFTTFSTFTMEAVRLIESGFIIKAFQYVLFSLICGLFAVKFGSLIGLSINNYIINSKYLTEAAIEELD